MLRLTFNPGLELTGFGTTWPRLLNRLNKEMTELLLGPE